MNRYAQRLQELQVVNCKVVSATVLEHTARLVRKLSCFVKLVR